MKKKSLKVPHVYVLLLAITAFCALLTYIVPAGQYEMMNIQTNGVEREVVDANSFEYIEKTPVGIMELLSSVPKGLQESAQIIFFIFIVGGSFAVVQATGAIEAGLGSLVKGIKGKEVIIIPIVSIAFGFAGATIGMAEEVLPFIPIFVALFVALGYDSMLGAGVVFCGAGAGFAGAFMNPFTVGVGQGIAGLPLFSGMGFRLIVFSCLLLITILFLISYAKKIKKTPELSPMYEIDRLREDNLDLNDLPEFSTKRKLILLIFLFSIFILVFGVIKLGWYMDEIAALFFGMSMICALVGGLGLNGFAIELAKGMGEIASGALVVGFARGILVVLTDGNIIHTILFSASNLLGQFNSTVSAVGMYIFQCLLNFAVPSGSGQAAISLPILAPLGDIVGVTRQTAVLAFQLGDGISNIFTPTSGYFMAGLALAKIPWEKWAKWILPLTLMQYTIGVIFVIIAHLTQFGPF